MSMLGMPYAPKGIWNRCHNARHTVKTIAAPFITADKDQVPPEHCAENLRTNLLVYLRRKEIEAGRFDENLIPSRQLQFTKALPADFDFNQFLVFAVIAHQLEANYRAHRENVGHMGSNCSLPIQGIVHLIHMDVMRTHIRHR